MIYYKARTDDIVHTIQSLIRSCQLDILPIYQGVDGSLIKEVVGGAAAHAEKALAPFNKDADREGPSLLEASVPGLHFMQDDSPHEIGQAIAEWHLS
ncbi:MAG: hypothetical protein ACJAY7_000031 [Pseudohongiellaceae bacterium]|jgi:hypothetical protein|tara:strand:- start:95 stop:385 length:291 start_codon:yes stop_codon:yes gene_type:complete